jgi:glycine cleavage system aminomethyltransferase T
MTPPPYEHVESAAQPTAKLMAGSLRSPLHERLVEQHARFGESGPWLYPLWFSPTMGDGAGPQTPAERSVANRIEHLAARSGVGIFDVSLLCKFVVTGPDALAMLNWLSTNDIDVPVGKITYTPWCDDHGRIIADVTVTRLGSAEFLVVGTDTVHQRIDGALRRPIAEARYDARVRDTTMDTAVISVQGPNTRTLINRLSDDDLSLDEFGYMTAEHITVAGVRTLALRLTYTGDLGFELHVPAAQSVHVYDALFAAGEGLDVRACGIDAMYSLGSEKGYLDFDYNIDETMTPLQAQLDFTIDWKKPFGFRGQVALEQLRRQGPPTTRVVLVCLHVPDRTIASGDAVMRNGRRVGSVVVASYGHSVGAAVGYVEISDSTGVTDEWVASGTWHVMSEHGRERAKVGTTAWFDPTRSRIFV